MSIASEISRIQEAKSNLKIAINNKGGDLTTELISDYYIAVNNIVDLNTGTADATAVAGDMLFGTTAYVKGSKVTGTITSKSAQTYTPTTSDQTINSGVYLSGNQTIKGDSYLVSSNIKSGVTIFGVSGSYTSDADALEGDLLLGKTAYVNGTKITGTITSKSSQTYTPTTTDQVISSGQYLSGNQTIKGDVNLVASNILNGVTIFGVTGTAQTGSDVTLGVVDANGNFQAFSFDGTTPSDSGNPEVVLAYKSWNSTLPSPVIPGGMNDLEFFDWTMILTNN